MTSPKQSNLKISRTDWFTRARYGLFIHFGLYSLLGRGEWVLNKEQIPVEEYRKLADQFMAENFDADVICDLAVRAGMRYVNLTTMHHDGFCLYDTALSDFNCMRVCGRDLVAELVDAARNRGLRIELYHSLNHWTAKPDAVDALESKDAYESFIATTHDRIRELVTRFNPIDVLWYDGWWPFNAEGWRAQEMNAMVQAIQPDILFNGRNGLPGDFGTPEGHLAAPTPYRPWEACMTLNNNWGFHQGDQEWKSPQKVIEMLATVAQGGGNLLLNIGPHGDGSVPEASARILEAVGAWVKQHGEAIFDTERFTFDLREKGDHRGDWTHHGPLTVSGNHLYWLVLRWCGESLTLGGLNSQVRSATLLSSRKPITFKQSEDRLQLTGLPPTAPDPICPVIRLECDRPPSIYMTGGLRVPGVDHPRYDPCPSDIQP